MNPKYKNEYQNDKRFVAVQDYECHEEAEQLLLINRLDSNWIRTNATGVKILELLKAPRQPREIYAELAAEYDLAADLIQESVEPFLKGAFEAGFIREFNGSPPEDIFRPLSQKTDWLETLPLMTIWLHVTNACNLKCVYCCLNSSPRADRSLELTLSEIESIYEGLPQGPQYKTVISGGEPFLRDDIQEIIKICKTHGQTCVTTNGVIEDPRTLMDSLGDIDEIQVSIDGPDESVHDRMRGKGSFAKTMQTVSRLNEAEYKNFWISTTATTDNVQHLSKMIRFAYVNGACGLYVGQLMPSGRSRDNQALFPDEAELKKELETLWHTFGTLADFHKSSAEFKFQLHISRDKLLRTIFGHKFHNCGLGGCGTISIAQDGNVYPCSQLHVDEFLIGNVRDRPFAEILEKGRETYDTINVDNLSVCKDCSVKYTCRGGCLALSYYANGDLKSKNPECEKNFQNVIDWSWSMTPRVYQPQYLRKNVFSTDKEST